MARGSGRRAKSDIDPEYWCEGEGLVEVQKWLAEKLTDIQIAKNIGVDRSTISRWKKRYETFNTIFKKEREVAIVELVNSAYKSANGYYYEEEALDAKGNKQTLKKWAQPSAATLMFLMKNWKRDEYRDRWEIDHSGALPVILKGEDQIPD